MAIFSTNQNRQFYVATSVGDVKEASTAGTIQVKSSADGLDKEFYFLVKGADTVLKSDRIPVKNLNYAKAISAADMVTPLKKVLVALDSSVNGGKPVIGQDYVLRINFRQFYGMSDEDQYFKDVAVRATKEMNTTPAKFYEALVSALNLSFSREVGATKDSNPYLSFASSASGVTITEKEQEWTLGKQSQERVYFDIVPTTIYVDGVDVVWGTKTDQTPAKKSAVVGTTAIGNGKKIADLEWFCMGERGDQYRQIGYPNNIDTKYLVDPSKQYNVLELHYAFTDTGVSSYRSEKDITIVSDSVTVINSLITAIKTATGISIDALATASTSD